MTTQERNSEHPPGFAQSPAGGMSADGAEPGADERQSRGDAADRMTVATGLPNVEVVPTA